MKPPAEGVSGVVRPGLRRVVVSGGNGYLGSSLIRRLIGDGVEVHALANENHQRLDALLPQAQVHVLREGADDAAEVVRRIQPDVIFHSAAVYTEPSSVENISSMINGNLALGAILLYGATLCAVRPAFINTGTYWQFGSGQSYSPNTLYAATKQGFQDILRYYQLRQRIRATTLVLYDVFGPNDDRPKLWNKITRCPPRTHIPLSMGTQEIQLVHIDDVVEAFIKASELLCTGHNLGTIYSVRSEDRHTLRDLLETFNLRSGLELSLGWGELPLWEGVVQKPWLGETLPQWSRKQEVMPALLAMATQESTL